MPRATVLLVVLLVCLPTTVPTGASVSTLPGESPGGWSTGGNREPDTHFDGPAMMWSEAPGASRNRIYFNAVPQLGGVGVNPNVATTGSQIQPAGAQSWLAYLGNWADCNADGFMGLAEQGVLEYRVELLFDTRICPPSDDAYSHNDGEWVRELIWIGPADSVGDQNLNGRIDDDIGRYAAGTFHDADTRVWGDHGLPGAGDEICPIMPPRGTTASTGGLLSFGDCHANRRVANNVNFAEHELFGDVGLGFEDPASPEASRSFLNQDFPTSLYGNPHAGEGGGSYQGGVLEDGRADGGEGHDPAFTAWDCSSSTIEAPTGISTPNDPTGPAGQGHLLAGRLGTREAGVTIWREDGRPADDPLARGVRIGGLDPRIEGDLLSPDRYTGRSWYDALNDSYDAMIDGCDTSDQDPAVHMLEQGGQHGSGRRENDIVFAFQGHPTPRDAHLPPGFALTDRNAPSDGGLTLTRASHGIGWVGHPNTMLESRLVHRDGQPSGAQYVSFYASIGGGVFGAGYRTPGGSSRYGAEACGSFTTGVHGGFDCDAGRWWTDQAGASVRPVQYYGPQSPTTFQPNPTSPFHTIPRALGGVVGQVYHMRDVDCFDGSLSAGSPAYLSLQYLTDDDACKGGAGVINHYWDVAPELDEDYNGLGDAFQRRYQLTRQQMQDITTTLTDFDLDNANLLLEFRWDTIPIALPELGYPLAKARDWDGDGWLDGDEIAYWNVNPDPLFDFAGIQYTQGVAYRDADSFGDSNGNGVPNQHDADSDNDGVPDGEEVTELSTYPEHADSDCTGLGTCPDPRDTKYRAAERAESGGDLIGDKEEHAYWTSRLSSGDGRGGGHLGDCDGDSIPNIRDPDSDNDELLDGDEILNGGDPCEDDADQDGLKDGRERSLGTDPLDPDTDDDGMPDGWEADHQLNPRVNDAGVSADGDLLTNLEEYHFGSDPRLADTDLDLLLDHEERALGTDPRWWDSDADGMPDGWESRHGLRPTAADGTEDKDGDIGDVDGDGLPEYVHTNYFEYATKRPATWNESVSGPWLGGTDPTKMDTDMDGKTDGHEVATGDDPSAPIPRFDQDADGDGLLLEHELERGTSPSVADSDNDGLCDGGGGLNCFHPCLGVAGDPGEANHYRSNPILRDSDADGLSDGEEACIFDAQRSGSTHDFDGDGAQSIVDPDSDGDELGDFEEAREWSTNPRLADSDADGLNDHDELVLSVARGHPTDPLDPDSDGDLLLDGEEVLVYGTWPDDADTDDDGLTDHEEVVTHQTSPFLDDTDADRMPDKWEVANNLDPLRNDANEDPDEDGIITGLTNYEEYALGLDGGQSTDPHQADTDGDGINDYWEVLFGLSPTSSNLDHDTDGDGLQDLGEFLLRSDPNAQDTDQDGLTDWEEAGTNDILVLATRLTLSDPTRADTDDDGLDDLREKRLWDGLGPLAWRADHDLDAPTTHLEAWSNLRDRDSDNDGFDDGQEFLVFGTRPDRADTDGDGDLDSVEVMVLWTNPHDANSNGRTRALTQGADTDGDGLSDADESLFGTDPKDIDSDDDGMPDGMERAAWGPRVAIDFDQDGTPNNLLDPDSDNDGTLDGIEIIASGLPRSLFYVIDPSSRDTDEDGLNDWEEATNGLELLTDAIAPAGSVRGAFGLWLQPRSSSGPGPSGGPGRAGDARSSPDQSDTDADCLKDGIERTLGSDPRNRDTDGDGVPDCVEPSAKAARSGQPVATGCASTYDADRDCLLDIVDDDDDGDGLLDGQEDVNGDGVRQRGETSAYDADTDDDGLCDNEEAAYGTRPTAADTDQDGLSDGLEVRKRGGCVTLHRSDWTLKNVALARGRLTFQDYLGPLAPIDPTNPQEDLDADGLSNPLDWDSDDDFMADGLEDWLPNGIVDAGEGNPRLSDGDGDGIPDSIELRVWGKMSYQTFLDQAARLKGTSDLEAAKKLATYDPASKIKTDPTKADTDGDGLADGLDIDPNGLSSPLIRIKLDAIGMQDWIDCDPWCNYRLDPYFKFEIETTFSTIRPETVNLAELPLGGPGELADISGLLLELYGADPSDISKTVQPDRTGQLIIELSDDITKLPVVPDANGNGVWDRVVVRVAVGDWDGENLRGTGGRDASDVVDITPDPNSASTTFEMAFRLSEFATRPREEKRDVPRPSVPDGAADGHGWAWSVDQEDDGILHFRVENTIKADFLNNANRLRSPLGFVPTPQGRGMEFGI